MKKYILLMSVFVYLSVPALAQKGKALKLMVQPVKISTSEVARQVTRALWRGKLPSVKAIKMDYLKKMNLQAPKPIELESQLKKSGVLVRSVSLPNSDISHVFTADGKNWYASSEIAQIVAMGFYVRLLPDGKIGFTIDGESPAFDFFNRELLLEMKRLKEAGFLFKNDKEDMFGIAFPQTAVSETPVYVMNKMGRVEGDDPIPMKYLSGISIVPQKTFTVEQGIWCYYPTRTSPMVSADGLPKAMAAYYSVYDGLNVILTKLGAYKDSVDIIWRSDKYTWAVRDAQGRIYDSVDEFLTGANIHP